MLTLVLGIVWLLLPAYAANMMPVFLATLIPRFDLPLDFGLSWGGFRIFGSHKTFRGLIGGTLVGVLIGFLQQYNSAVLASVALVDYASINAPLLGGLLAFGALFGDAIKSFFKRRVGIPPGGRWLPFDQIDFVLGAYLFALPLYLPSSLEFIVALVGTFFATILVKRLGYWTGLSTVKW